MKPITQLFDNQAATYASARPNYPVALFEFLATLAPRSSTVWDCACGNGQVSADLIKYFDHVIATDVSDSQIAHAKASNRIDYRVAKSEKSGLKSQSIDLITIGQALHWFDFEPFYHEVKRILKPNGFIAAFTYGNFRFRDEKLNEAFDYLYFDILWNQDCWSSRRKFIDKCYQNIPFPFKRLPTPKLTMTNTLTRDQFYQYLHSWSSVQHYKEKKQDDPIATHLMPKMDKLWQDKNTKKQLTAPLTIILGKNTSLE